MSEPKANTNHTTSNRDERKEPKARYISPAVDIYEDEKASFLVVDLPGVDQESVSVIVENGVLTLDAYATARRAGKPVYREFADHRYLRRFTLSDEVDMDGITVDMREGVLTLRLPTSEKAKPRRIEIKSASA